MNICFPMGLVKKVFNHFKRVFLHLFLARFNVYVRGGAKGGQRGM